MIIQSHGLFWRADEINWFPGKGQKQAWRLLGRRGATTKTLQLADFKGQTGIYILYGNLGPYYVGLTRKKGLGPRLKDHLDDKHKGQWDPFSWFGFKSLTVANGKNGMMALKQLPLNKAVQLPMVIGDLEAMLIKAMALQNVNSMNFKRGKEWTQVKLDEVVKYTSRLRK